MLSADDREALKRLAAMEKRAERLEQRLKEIIAQVQEIKQAAETRQVPRDNA